VEGAAEVSSHTTDGLVPPLAHLDNHLDRVEALEEVDIPSRHTSAWTPQWVAVNGEALWIALASETDPSKASRKIHVLGDTPCRRMPWKRPESFVVDPGDVEVADLKKLGVDPVANPLSLVVDSSGLVADPWGLVVGQLGRVVDLAVDLVADPRSLVVDPLSPVEDPLSLVAELSLVADPLSLVADPLSLAADQPNLVANPVSLVPHRSMLEAIPPRLVDATALVSEVVRQHLP